MYGNEAMTLRFVTNKQSSMKVHNVLVQVRLTYLCIHNRTLDNFKAIRNLTDL